MRTHVFTTPRRSIPTYTLRGCAATHAVLADTADRTQAQVNRLQLIHHVGPTPHVIGTRALPSRVQIHADPPLVVHTLQNPMTPGKIDLPVPQVVDAVKELRRTRILRQNLPIRMNPVARRRRPLRVLIVQKPDAILIPDRKSTRLNS